MNKEYKGIKFRGNAWGDTWESPLISGWLKFSLTPLNERWYLKSTTLEHIIVKLSSSTSDFDSAVDESLAILINQLNDTTKTLNRIAQND